MTTILGGEVHRVKADVVVIGGGTAGLNTALAAAVMGADVLVVDKGHIQRGGAVAGGIDHFFAYLDTGPSWDTRDAYLAYVSKVARGAANLKIHEKVFCDELTPAMERIERMGVSLHQPDGSILRTQALGQPGPIAINFDGKLLKPKMAFQMHSFASLFPDADGVPISLIPQTTIMTTARMPAAPMATCTIPWR